MDALTMLPLWLSGLVLVGTPTALAMTGTFLIRHRVSFNSLQSNNEVAGFKFATVGVLYAVLLAFAVVVVWEKFNEADNQVAKEAGAAATLYRLWAGMGGEGGPLEESTSDYLRSVIDDEWPQMQMGLESPKPTEALNRIYAELLKVQPSDSRGAAVLYEALYQLDQMTQARRARLVSSAGVVPGILWVVLVAGAVLTIAFTFFFGCQNLRAQMMMTGALSVLIFSGLLIIIAIDRPFTGTVTVNPDALATVLADFGGRAASQR
jgi:hypothetical protein